MHQTFVEIDFQVVYKLIFLNIICPLNILRVSYVEYIIFLIANQLHFEAHSNCEEIFINFYHIFSPFALHYLYQWSFDILKPVLFRVKDQVIQLNYLCAFVTQTKLAMNRSIRNRQGWVRQPASTAGYPVDIHIFAQVIFILMQMY